MIGITVFSATMIRFSTLKRFWVKKVISVTSRMMTQIDNKFESTNRVDHMICDAFGKPSMSHAPTMLKSDWSLFENAPSCKIMSYRFISGSGKLPLSADNKEQSTTGSFLSQGRCGCERKKWWILVWLNKVLITKCDAFVNYFLAHQIGISVVFTHVNL